MSSLKVRCHPVYSEILWIGGRIADKTHNSKSMNFTFDGLTTDWYVSVKRMIISFIDQNIMHTYFAATLNAMFVCLPYYFCTVQQWDSHRMLIYIRALVLFHLLTDDMLQINCSFLYTPMKNYMIHFLYINHFQCSFLCWTAQFTGQKTEAAQKTPKIPTYLIKCHEQNCSVCFQWLPLWTFFLLSDCCYLLRIEPILSN